MTDWAPPRCRHNKILGSCDFDRCEEERAFWQDTWARIEIYEAGMAANLPKAHYD